MIRDKDGGFRRLRHSRERVGERGEGDETMTTPRMIAMDTLSGDAGPREVSNSFTTHKGRNQKWFPPRRTVPFPMLLFSALGNGSRSLFLRVVHTSR